jgi:hypothetical protein
VRRSRCDARGLLRRCDARRRAEAVRVFSFRPFTAALLLATVAGGCGIESKSTPIYGPEDTGPAALRWFQPNQCQLLVSDDGSRTFSEDATFVVRKGSVFYDLGLWIGARVDGQVRVSATSYYGSEFRPLILPKGGFVLVYALRPDDGPGDADYDGWPASIGAPVDSAGHPVVLGDATAWTGYQDRDPTWHTKFRTPALGAEVRQTVWGYAAEDSVLYQRFDVKNTSSSPWDEVYFGIWVDPDLGDPENDLVGCDVPRALGYAYTGAGGKETAWGAYLPAAGIRLLETPGSAGLYAFPRIWKLVNEPKTAEEAYNLLRGLNVDGEAFLDSTTGEATRYTASGDPVSGQGSIEHVPADRRMMLVTGPFTQAAGESLSVVYAIVFARATDRLEAVAALRRAADAAGARRRVPSGASSPRRGPEWVQSRLFGAD